MGREPKFAYGWKADIPSPAAPRRITDHIQPYENGR